MPRHYGKEVFLKVHTSINKFNKNSSLYTWIYRIATNLLYVYVHSASLKKS
ncbi:MAG: hypothetical protein GY754_12650 [bacterium]|nr:hypothetical protein [bacterium]